MFCRLGIGIASQEDVVGRRANGTPVPYYANIDLFSDLNGTPVPYLGHMGSFIAKNDAIAHSGSVRT